ncbi:MAG TPA: cyclodeaminase/cyclohydrolase family protein, partial [Solirubrobacteraceae bacterium]|nr:cyclodeaminase/cyclohydrolase family protein [Solirubrobacteraceae bacterium]
MAALGEQRLADVLDAVAAPTPAPGGGSTAGIVCALAAALVEMVAGIGDGDVAAVRALRARALDLAEQELSSYAPVLEARRLPADDPARPGRIAAALEQASAAPREIAAVAAEVAALAERAGSRAGAAVR